LSSGFDRLLAERKILKARTTRPMVSKELEAAESDLQDARSSLAAGNAKWATIQGYYSMFHAARALLYDAGYREKSHNALLAAVKHLYARKLGPRLIDSFRDAMDLREEADYNLKFSNESAESTVEGAQAFLDGVKGLLNYRP